MYVTFKVFITCTCIYLKNNRCTLNLGNTIYKSITGYITSTYKNESTKINQ